MYDEGPSRRDCLPGNQRSNMMMKDARLLSQLLVGVYTDSAFISIDVKSNAREKDEGNHTPLLSRNSSG